MPNDDGIIELADEDIVHGLSIDQRHDNIDGRVLLDDDDETNRTAMNRKHLERIHDASSYWTTTKKHI
jgi:hypothetical protein